MSEDREDEVRTKLILLGCNPFRKPDSRWVDGPRGVTPFEDWADRYKCPHTYSKDIGTMVWGWTSLEQMLEDRIRYLKEQKEEQQDVQR